MRAVEGGATEPQSLAACASCAPIPAHLLIRPSSLPAIPALELPASLPTITTPPLQRHWVVFCLPLHPCLFAAQKLANMRVTALLFSLLTATTVSSRSLFGGNQNALVDEPQYPVPGKNPLNVRIQHIILLFRILILLVLCRP